MNEFFALGRLAEFRSWLIKSISRHWCGSADSSLVVVPRVQPSPISYSQIKAIPHLFSIQNIQIQQRSKSLHLDQNN